MHASNRVECDHGRGHGFVQNLRRGHYELGIHALNERLRDASAFDELVRAI